MLTEWQNFGITEMLKTVYPTKNLFCGGINTSSNRDNKFTVNVVFGRRGGGMALQD